MALNKSLEKSYTHLIKQDDLKKSKNEEQLANLFAALLLVPRKTLYTQIEILKIANKNLQLLDIIKLMDVFVVPYKTIVLRLYETGFIKDRDYEPLGKCISDDIDNEQFLIKLKQLEDNILNDCKTAGKSTNLGEIKTALTAAIGSC